LTRAEAKARWRGHARAAVAILVATLAACAPVQTRDAQTGVPTRDAAFDVTGRLSARHRTEAASAGFRWSHRPDGDELSLASPLGQTLAELRGDTASVRLTLPDGRIAQARDWEALTANVLGAPLPVRGLAWWIRGVGHPGSPHTIERDAGGARAAVLRQDGWEIVYEARDGERPLRLRMTYPETEIRLVIDNWASPGR
jgi:outer membrane lipoprotein LolB